MVTRALFSHKVAPPYCGSSGPQYSANFLSNTILSNMVFTRASVATDVVNGVLTDFASGAIRQTIENGYLSELARTNSIRNGEAQGATVGVIGAGGALPTNWVDVNTVGLTREIVGFGTINGFNYLDIKISGTPSAGTYELLFDSATQIAASSTQTWSSSCYIGLIGGSLTGITTTAVRTSGRAAGVELEGTSQTLTPTIDPTRYFAIRTLNNAGTTNVIAQLSFAVTAVAINATFRIAACQCEQGYGATSYIRTTSAAASRAADVMYLLNSNIPGFSSTQGTLVISAKTPPFYAAGVTTQSMATFNNNGGGDYIWISKNANGGTGAQLRMLNGYATNGFAQTSALALNADVKVAAAWIANDIAISLNGAAASAGSPNPAVVPTTDRLFIGLTTTGDNGQFCGYIKQIDYYNTRKSNASLAVLSA